MKGVIVVLQGRIPPVPSYSASSIGYGHSSAYDMFHAAHNLRHFSVAPQSRALMLPPALDLQPGLRHKHLRVYTRLIILRALRERLSSDAVLGILLS